MTILSSHYVVPLKVQCIQVTGFATADRNKTKMADRQEWAESCDAAHNGGGPQFAFYQARYSLANGV